MVFGVLGCLLCIVERKATSSDGSIAQMYARLFGCCQSGACVLAMQCSKTSDVSRVSVRRRHDEADEAPFIAPDALHNGVSTSLSSTDSDSYAALDAPAPSVARSLLLIGVPFFGLALTYSLWFVTQKLVRLSLLIFIIVRVMFGPETSSSFASSTTRTARMYLAIHRSIRCWCRSTCFCFWRSLILCRRSSV